ncbi:DNA (cytosine-5)-methyltransferase 1 [Paenibacillus algorifonticola]|uniref:Cytosine-specific methyltransferase n=2 Tax=Paenibacillus algorifonticola TaxID=684063 RepID=A0A1I2H3K4_9BACL|nr:DNA (cytosine-5)-methyltransferase 1 [Paenibacillus algorifonticola]
MAEGFLQAGFKIPNACDFSAEAALTYQNRHKQLGYSDLKFYQGDIKNLAKPKKLKEFLNGNEISVVVGGPPCQGFSLTGKRDENDFRNFLFLEFLKIIKLVKPKYFVMENVEGILSYKFSEFVGLSGRVYENHFVTQIIREEAYKIGYEVRFEQLNAKNYGVPQNRPRVIFFGHRIKKYKNKKVDLVSPPEFPGKKSEVITVYEAISDLSFLTNGKESDKYNENFIVTNYQKQLRQGITPNINGQTIMAHSLKNHKAAKHQNRTERRFSLLKSGESIGELLKRLDKKQYKELKTKKYRCTKLHINDVAPTVLTLPDDIVHYEKGNSRILTVRELARLQSFDDSFEFLGKRTTGGVRRKLETPQYTQVGNAVPPLFARAIAIEIRKALIRTVNNSKK